MVQEELVGKIFIPEDATEAMRLEKQGLDVPGAQHGIRISTAVQDDPVTWYVTLTVSGFDQHRRYPEFGSLESGVRVHGVSPLQAYAVAFSVIDRFLKENDGWYQQD